MLAEQMINIRPYEAVGPLHFGMSQDEVIAILGDPQSMEFSKYRDGEIASYFGWWRVTIAEEGMVEIGLVPLIPINICGINIFSDPDAFAKLCQIDGEPKEILGFIVFFNLGITMTGFHDGDESQLAVTVFARHRWDKWKPDMNPFDYLTAMKP